MGGSLGARQINKLVAEKLDFFDKNQFQLLWQCGKLYYQEYKKYNKKEVSVFQFIEQMELAYAAADIIICRAGALTVSELCIVGKPVVFIPSPNVAEDHQTKNASAIAQQDAAILIEEKDLANRFENEFLSLIKNPKKQEALSKNIKQLAIPDATKNIVNQIDILIKTSANTCS